MWLFTNYCAISFDVFFLERNEINKRKLSALSIAAASLLVRVHKFSYFIIIFFFK